MKILTYALLIVSSLIVLSWPLVAFVGIFTFDAPIRNTFDLVTRYGFFLLLISYPWGLLVAVIRILRRKKGEDWCTKSNLILISAPILQLILWILLVNLASLIELVF